MPRGSKKKKRNIRRFFIVALIPAILFGLALSSLWKSNKAKAYYADLKRLDDERTNLLAEVSSLENELSDLKSISKIGAIATSQFGLISSVYRTILPDPVAQEEEPDKMEFVDLNLENPIEKFVASPSVVNANGTESPQRKAD